MKTFVLIFFHCALSIRLVQALPLDHNLQPHYWVYTCSVGSLPCYNSWACAFSLVVLILWNVLSVEINGASPMTWLSSLVQSPYSPFQRCTICCFSFLFFLKISVINCSIYCFDCPVLIVSIVNFFKVLFYTKQKNFIIIIYWCVIGNPAAFKSYPWFSSDLVYWYLPI